MLYDMLLVARPGPTIVKGLQKLIPRAFPSGDTVMVVPDVHGVLVPFWI